jgi:hypothetical protein
MDGYRVERHKHGIVVIGPVPVDDMCHLLKGWAADDRYDLVDAAVAQHFGASMAVTTKEGSKIWRRELGIAEDAE